jgi:hypothetical protein
MAARVRMPGELDFSGVDLAQSAGITGALILWGWIFFSALAMAERSEAIFYR